MENILVTGAGGYIGSVLVNALLSQGYRVRAVDRFFFGRGRLPFDERLTVLREDVRRLKPEHFVGVGAVIDLAAISNDPSGELFQDATMAINHQARVQCAKLAKMAGVTRYILPSSCSIYGFQPESTISDEKSPTNPITTYAKANEKAERDILPFADDKFVVVILRQATVYGLSPRMRFDLAINGMTYGAYKFGVLPLMRDGTQWRPMVHVRDTCDCQIMMLTADAEKVNGQIFNVGSTNNVYQLKNLGEIVAKAVTRLTSRDVRIEWYGDPDHRSYRVGFDKIEALGWRAKHCAEDAVIEICDALRENQMDRTTDTLTLEWYKTLQHWQTVIKSTEMYGGILNIE